MPNAKKAVVFLDKYTTNAMLILAFTPLFAGIIIVAQNI